MSASLTVYPVFGKEPSVADASRGCIWTSVEDAAPSESSHRGRPGTAALPGTLTDTLTQESSSAPAAERRIYPTLLQCFSGTFFVFFPAYLVKDLRASETGLEEFGDSFLTAFNLWTLLKLFLFSSTFFNGMKCPGDARKW